MERTREYSLEEILWMAIAARWSGANGWNEIEDFAHSKHPWFQSFLTLPSGIPSHDTLRGASEPSRKVPDKMAIAID